MLTEFDQNTIANMTAALEYVCKRIPTDKDGHEIRKRIADAMIACGEGTSFSGFTLSIVGAIMGDARGRSPEKSPSPRCVPPAFAASWSTVPIISVACPTCRSTQSYVTPEQPPELGRNSGTTKIGQQR